MPPIRRTFAGRALDGNVCTPGARQTSDRLYGVKSILHPVIDFVQKGFLLCQSLRQFISYPVQNLFIRLTSAMLPHDTASSSSCHHCPSRLDDLEHAGEFV